MAGTCWSRPCQAPSVRLTRPVSLARLTKSHAVGDPDGTPADVMKVSYAHDDGSNPTWRYDEKAQADSLAWSQKYEYDSLDRLVKATQGTVTGWPGSPSMSAPAAKTWVWDGTVGEETYTLDKVGNWDKFYNDGTDDDRSHNAVNEITGRTIGGQTKNPTWDNTGCLTDDGENYKYVYDFRNRLVQAKRRGDNSLLAEYSYDGLNRRIRKVVFDTDGETELSDTRYLYDGWRCVEERDENDSHELRARYVYGGLYIDEPLRMYRDTNSDGDFADAGDVNVYYLQDRLFNVVALTDTDGAIVERTWYEPYGKPTNRRESDGDETVASHLGNPLLFCGYRLDGETSSFDVRNRQYQPTLGTWLQRDPADYHDSLNIYVYARNEPIALTDPDGQVVVVFKGWKKKLKQGMVSHEVVLAIRDVNLPVQDAKEFESTEEGLAAAKQFVLDSVKKHGTPGCPEPVYIAGYSLGSRAAQLLARDLAQEKTLWTEKNRAGIFSLPMVVFFDYNWGAHHFDQAGLFGTIGRALKEGTPHAVPADVSLVLHFYTTGKLTTKNTFKGKTYANIVDITTDIYADYDAGHRGRLLWNYGSVGLANTTGALAWQKVPGFRGLGLPVNTDHLQLGGNRALGELTGYAIRAHYAVYWWMNHIGLRK